LFAERGFEIFGINVQAGRGDDDAFLAAAKTQVAFGVELAKIAGAEPTTVGFARGSPSALFPVT